jgi:hypothetical protein
MRRPDADLEEKRGPRVASSAGAQKGDSMKSSGWSLTLAAIEKRPCRQGREPAGFSGETLAAVAASWTYSITSSARASKDCGTVRPSVRAVLRLKTSSVFVACTTGRSAAFAPARTRVNIAAPLEALAEPGGGLAVGGRIPSGHREGRRRVRRSRRAAAQKQCPPGTVTIPAGLLKMLSR